jgi:xanthine/uracil permease
VPKPEPNPETPEEIEERKDRENYNSMVFSCALILGIIGALFTTFCTGDFEVGGMLGGLTGVILTLMLFHYFCPYKKKVTS